MTYYSMTSNAIIEFCNKTLESKANRYPYIAALNIYYDLLIFVCLR